MLEPGAVGYCLPDAAAGLVFGGPSGRRTLVGEYFGSLGLESFLEQLADVEIESLGEDFRGILRRPWTGDEQVREHGPDIVYGKGGAHHLGSHFRALLPRGVVRRSTLTLSSSSSSSSQPQAWGGLISVRRLIAKHRTQPRSSVEVCRVTLR